MKTERIMPLTSPKFKAFLTTEARREKVSVAELIRSRCEGRSSEIVGPKALTAELRADVSQAKQSQREGLAEADTILANLRAKQAKVPAGFRTKEAANRP